MAITLLPSGPQTAVTNIPLCFNASSVVTIPQEDWRNIDLPSSGTNWTYTSTDSVYKKTGGSNNSRDADAVVSTPINPLQPFTIVGTNWTFSTPGGANNNTHAYVGIVVDDDLTNKTYAFQFLKYCNSNNSSCNATSGSDWIGTVKAGASDPYFRTVNFKENFRVRSNGISLYYEHQQAGIWLTDYITTLPAGTSYKFVVGALYVNNEAYFVKTFKGSFTGSVPLYYTAPLGGTLTGTGNSQCFYSDTPGLYQVCVNNDYDEELCVDVEVGDLYFIPNELDCGGCVFTDTEVTFQSNGQQNGTLTATAGTVIDSLTWIAPSFPTTVTLRYEIGDVFEECEINVVPRLEVANVEGNTITGLLPGDQFQLITNYDPPYGQVVWYNLDCPNIVTPDGLLTIPQVLSSNCFGALDCTIRVVLVDIEGEACDNLIADIPTTPIITLVAADSETEVTAEWTESGGCGFGYNYIDLRIIVEPMYPTPDLGGPQYVKWAPQTPDFRVISNEFEGGCDETYIRNPVPIYRWQADYDGLPYGQPCAPAVCCDEPQGAPLGILPESRTASILDDFWNFVYGTHGYFTLIEPRTGRVWQRVKFEEEMTRDHTTWNTVQSRNVSLIWRPCCDSQPAGGTCSHLQTTRDLIFPTIPENVAASVQTPYWIQVTWLASKDNVGIQGYEIEINGVVTNIGHTLTYNHKPVTPFTLYTYRVRAYDFDNNRSLWSAPAIISTTDGAPVLVVEGGEQVQEGGEDVVEV
jgi:hypothetical protein